MIGERMKELGLAPPPLFPPAGNYLGCVVDGDIVYVGGHGPISVMRIPQPRRRSCPGRCCRVARRVG
jgi:hypothetical protein